MDPTAQTTDVPSEAAFGVAVGEWMRVLRTIQKDAKFAAAVERNDVLRSIATRRLSQVEATAVDAPDLDDLTKINTTHGEVLWMLGARHACDALAVRIAKEALDSPVRLTSLIAEAREVLSDAVPMAQQLAVWEQHDELGPTYVRFATAVAELQEEMERYSAIAWGLHVEAEGRTDRGDHILAWGRVLDRIRARPDVWDDTRGVVEQTRALVEGLVTRNADVVSRELVRGLVRTYDRLLLTARAHGQSIGDEELCRLAEHAYKSTRKVLNRLLPPTIEEQVAERAERDRDLAALEPPRVRVPLLSPAKARGLAAIVLMVMVALGSALYVGFLRPSLNYTALDDAQVRALWPELTGGYVVDRPEGQLFVGYLVRADQQAPPPLVAAMSEKILEDLSPFGVTDVLILDRNATPIGFMQGDR